MFIFFREKWFHLNWVGVGEPILLDRRRPDGLCVSGPLRPCQTGRADRWASGSTRGPRPAEAGLGCTGAQIARSKDRKSLEPPAQSARKEHGGVGRAGHITWAEPPWRSSDVSIISTHRYRWACSPQPVGTAKHGHFFSVQARDGREPAWIVTPAHRAARPDMMLAGRPDSSPHKKLPPPLQL